MNPDKGSSSKTKPSSKSSGSSKGKAKAKEPLPKKTELAEKPIEEILEKTHLDETKDFNLYSMDNKKQAQITENIILSKVHERFFRVNKAPREKTLQLIEKIKRVKNLLDATYLDLATSKDKDYFKIAAKAYAARAIELNGYTARTVTIALIQILNLYNKIPTLAFKIGGTYILCVSNPTRDNKGNVMLQVINGATGAKIFIPSVYGDGNAGRTKTSIASYLKSIINTPSKYASHFSKMKSFRQKIASFEEAGIRGVSQDDIHFLNQLNLLHSIIEVARRAHLKAKGGAKELAALPLGVAQTRTSTLLIEQQITIDDAYGLDRNNPPIYSADEREDNKAPYGATTGKRLDKNVAIVTEKILRINEKYNERYDDKAPGKFSIEGRRLARSRLGDDYGSDDESTGGNYSEEDIDELEGIERIPFSYKR